jgi:hypothetical protein
MEKGKTVAVEFTCVEDGEKTGVVILQCSDRRFEGKPRLTMGVPPKAAKAAEAK